MRASLLVYNNNYANDTIKLWAYTSCSWISTIKHSKRHSWWRDFSEVTKMIYRCEYKCSANCVVLWFWNTKVSMQNKLKRVWPSNDAVITVHTSVSPAKMQGVVSRRKTAPGHLASIVESYQEIARKRRSTVLSVYWKMLAIRIRILMRR